MRERLINAHNYNQRFDMYKRVLCICSGGLLRSPTTAFVLAQEPYNFNTRSAGIDSHHALTLVDEVLVGWADEFVVMNKTQKFQLHRFDLKGSQKPIVVLDIPDRFQYRDPELIDLIRAKYSLALVDARRELEVDKEPIPVDLDTAPKEEGKGPPVTFTDEHPLNNDF